MALTVTSPLVFSDELLNPASCVHGMEVLHMRHSVAADIDVEGVHSPNRLQHPRPGRQYKRAQPQRVDLKSTLLLKKLITCKSSTNSTRIFV